MKANELMIWDWVRCTDPKPFRIEQIDGVEEQAYGDDGFYVDTADLQPIPLTVEILSKNNFEKHFDDDIVIYTHPQGITIEMGINYKLFNDGHFFVRGILHRLYYVHELQHALRLCGIEKEIEL